MFLEAVKTGILKGLRTALMLLRIIIPIFACVVFLRHTPLFAWLASIVAPAMRLFGLPGEAVVPIIVGVFSDEYAVAAAMSGIGFDKAQLTIIAMIALCCHAIPVETVITRAIGMPALKIALFRIGLAVFTGVICSWLAAAFLNGSIPGSISAGAGMPAAAEFAGIVDAAPLVILAEIGWGALSLVLTILRVIIPLMVGVELMLNYKIVDALAKKLTPFCRLIGIGKDALLPLLIGLLLGVTYGAGALAELKRTNPLGKKDMAVLGVFLFSCHGIIETTYLFAISGASGIFTSALRLAIAILVTAGFGRILAKSTKE